MKKRKTVAVVSVLLVVALLLCAVSTFAKYLSKKGRQSELNSQNFYFSSNFLKADEVPTYEIYGNTVTFQVRNYIDSLRINPTNINYTVSTDGGTVLNGNGSLTGAASSSANINLSCVFAADELQKEITVSVTGTGDFTQTLKAKFIFIKKDGLRYEIKDQENRDYAELYIYTGNTARVVTINWDNTKLLIDETNDYVFGKLNGNKNSAENINIVADTTVKIVFFKKDISKNYETDGLKEFDGIINMPTN